MSLQWLKVAAVVAAREHNPTILHPAFLRSEGIVPPDWETAEDPVCTPAFATVHYRNFIRFAVEGSRLQVVQTHPGADLSASPVPDLAVRYIRKLPHVRYTDVEVRLEAFWPTPEPPAFLIERFLKPGPWNDAHHRMDSLGLRFEYTVERTLLLDLYLDAGSVERDGDDENGIIVHGNYSQELTGEQPVTPATAILERWKDLCRRFQDTARTVLEMGK